MELRVVVLALSLVLISSAAQAQTTPPVEIPLPVIELASDIGGGDNSANVIACRPGGTVPGVFISQFCPVDVIVPTDATVVCIQLWNNVRRVVVPQAQTLGQPRRENCQTVFANDGTRLSKVRLHVPRPTILTGSILYVPMAVRSALQPLIGTRVGIIPDASFSVFACGLGGACTGNDVVAR